LWFQWTTFNVPTGIAIAQSIQKMYDALNLQLWVVGMSEYEKSKTTRRIVAVVYLLVLGFILGGTYLSQRQKQATNQATPAMQQTSG
jgi:hypothetical protein